MTDWTTTEEGEHFATVRDQDEMIEVTVKRNGCVDYLKAWNGDWEDTGSIHICSIDRMIVALLRLKELGKAKFGEEWES
jgi:hypothetical protein